VRFANIRDAETAGIAVITQEFALVDELSVAENIFLGRAPRRGMRVDWLEMRQRAAALLAGFGLAIAPETPVRELGIGQKQLVEIVRAMDKKTRVLVLDEPTAALTGQEVAVLLDHLRRLRAQGTACIYISHKLDEVFAIADRITVLRDGASITTLATPDATVPLVIKHMVGRELGDLFPRRPAVGIGEVQLAVRGLQVAPAKNAPPFLRGISFELRGGEVLGFGGLMGAGRTELLMHIFGAWGQRVSGEVLLHGRPYNHASPRDSIARARARERGPPPLWPRARAEHRLQPFALEPPSIYPRRKNRPACRACAQPAFFRVASREGARPARAPPAFPAATSRKSSSAKRS
jgi:D-xylose transport system ATP-binding protein